jgi:hypothetical protein
MYTHESRFIMPTASVGMAPTQALLNGGQARPLNFILHP